ncbi:uncharacterized protein LAESUDRAFT_713694 [Laetiporus sulphureus 93-53]|uniref:BTB domain-containing protein n=1 Tax=Laetiporus sulphureus 93-53 TaxID=1314785 RepID=A0A165EJQ6_9APHY|nr:uncharacterized protein LAESUDRAFT_713694 [Laetiporus sulphureus 93-53]KZT07195.1 hypothetical protein LAESUDRAFT_713694 [Laetiporus sulphureus 93-53]
MAAMAGPTPEEQVQDLWYDDGNVILCAGHSWFRVHRTMLLQHSPVFRDMFMIPPSPDVEMIDGCPVIFLPDDPTHLEYLLRTIYYMSRPIIHSNGPAESFLRNSRETRVVLGIISLAHKYLMRDLLSEATKCICARFPSTFAEFVRTMDRPRAYCVSIARPDAILIINVARRIQPSPLDAVLPFVFYLCCQLDPSLLTEGVLSADGTVQRLCTEDLMRCLNGRFAMLKANVEATKCFRLPLSGPLGTCRAIACKRAAREITELAELDGLYSRIDAFASKDAWIVKMAQIFGLCEKCTRGLVEAHYYGREAVWDELTTIFRLD